MKIKTNSNEDTAWVQWGKLGKEHCGNTEELMLRGCCILIDRNKEGKVCALEVLPEKSDKKGR